MSKFYKFLLLIGIVFTFSAYAIPKGPCDKVEVCCEEPTDVFAFSYPKDVGLSCPRNFYAHGDFLLMKPTEDGLEYAMEQDAATSYIFPLEVGKVKGFSSGSQEWDWRPGFRVGLGYFTNHDFWNIEFDWTYLRIKADSNVDNGGGGNLLALFVPPGAGAEHSLPIPHASARWSGDFNTMDLMIGKPYHVSRYFISNPMFGIRAAWIDQDYHVRYFIAEIKRNVYHKNDYWGMGLRASYEGEFLLGSGWLLYGKTAFAVLYGKFDLSQHSDIDSPSTIFEYKMEDSFYNVQPNAELSFGISWNKFFHKGQYKASLNVGYEFHQWWDQNQLRRFFDTDPVANDTTSRGDLAFNGFMFGLNFDF